LSIVNDEN
jgi:hypothetical protein